MPIVFFLSEHHTHDFSDPLLALLLLLPQELLELLFSHDFIEKVVSVARLEAGVLLKYIHKLFSALQKHHHFLKIPEIDFDVF